MLGDGDVVPAEGDVDRYIEVFGQFLDDVVAS
jgi:hypothetical protein